MSDTHEQGSVFVDDQSYRLPTIVTPERYQIRLTPNLKTFTFAGEESITISIHESVKEISFNAAELIIHHASVTGVDGKAIVGAVQRDVAQKRRLGVLRRRGGAGEIEIDRQRQHRPERAAAVIGSQQVAGADVVERARRRRASPRRIDQDPARRRRDAGLEDVDRTERRRQRPAVGQRDRRHRPRRAAVERCQPPGSVGALNRGRVDRAAG